MRSSEISQIAYKEWEEKLNFNTKQACLSPKLGSDTLLLITGDNLKSPLFLGPYNVNMIRCLHNPDMISHWMNHVNMTSDWMTGMLSKEMEASQGAFWG